VSMFVRLAEKLIDLYSDKSGAVDRDRVSLSWDFCPEKNPKNPRRFADSFGHRFDRLTLQLQWPIKTRSAWR